MACVIVTLQGIEVIDSPTSVDFSVLRTERLFLLIHSLFRADKPPLGFFLFG